MNITLKHLRYFEALARHGHFGRAAEACSISQPALSVQMKELEAQFGAPLIERGAREIRLSRLGEELVARARDILRSVEELDELARVFHGPLAGPFKLGVIPTIAPYLLPDLVKRLTADYPDLDPRLRETVTPNLVRDVLDGRLDAAILALPISEPQLHEEALFDEDFVLVRHSDDAGKPVPRPEVLSEMRLLLLEEGHCFRDQALTYCNASGGKPRQLMEGSSLTTLVQMVGAGIGVTLIPEMAIPIEAASAEVSIARLPQPGARRRIGMIWRRSSPLSESFGQIADAVRRTRKTAANRPQSRSRA